MIAVVLSPENVELGYLPPPPPPPRTTSQGRSVSMVIDGEEAASSLPLGPNDRQSSSPNLGR